jgi:transposase
MVKYREILRLDYQNVTKRGIASSCKCSRNTITEVLERAREKGISWPLPEEIGDRELQKILFPEKHAADERYLPDMDYVHKEMAKNGVTLSLLWHEYVLVCRNGNKIPYSYRQFCREYNKFATSTKATMRIKRKPAESLEVDWAGSTMEIRDRETGEINKVYLFVASLPCSSYSYVEGFYSMDSLSWITGHIHTFEFIGGVTRTVVPDNLKTGIEKPSSTEPVINRTYQELAEHYQTVIMPARVRKPKDKPSVEGTVGKITTWIIASLRNQVFFTLSELNEAVWLKLEEFNQKEFQKKKGSRLTAFLEEEKFALLPLPASRYEMAHWKKATVQPDYHISEDKMYYSVPYEYIKHVVEIRVTRTMVEVFFNNFRIASHKRQFGKDGQASTNFEHLPAKHQQFLTFTPEHFIDWGESVGPYTSKAVTTILTNGTNEKQALKLCLALSKLVSQYSERELEVACEKSLAFSPRVSLNTLKTILKTEREITTTTHPKKKNISHSNEHGFVRGADYYGRKDK